MTQQPRTPTTARRALRRVVDNWTDDGMTADQLIELEGGMSAIETEAAAEAFRLGEAAIMDAHRQQADLLAQIEKAVLAVPVRKQVPSTFPGADGDYIAQLVDRDDILAAIRSAAPVEPT